MKVVTEIYGFLIIPHNKHIQSAQINIGKLNGVVSNNEKENLELCNTATNAMTIVYVCIVQYTIVFGVYNLSYKMRETRYTLHIY